MALFALNAVFENTPQNYGAREQRVQNQDQAENGAFA